MSAACGPGCGWCGRCSAAWERETDDAETELEDQHRREQNDATYTAAVLTWFRKTDKDDKEIEETLEPPF